MRSESKAAANPAKLSVSRRSGGGEMMFRLIIICAVYIFVDTFLVGCTDKPESPINQLPDAYRALSSSGLVRVDDAVEFGGKVEAAPMRVECEKEDSIAIDAEDPPQCALLELALLGTTYRAYLLSRRHARLVIYNEGHCYCEQKTLAGAICAGSELFMKKVLSYADVLFMDMPLYGSNADQLFDLDGKVVSGCDHEWFSLVDGPSRSGLAYFFDPIKLYVDSLIQEYDSIDMVGRSGGGWTATIYAALDHRIRKSISIAGTLPMGLRGPEIDGRDDIGDWEQHEAYIYHRFDYGVLYALAAYGNNGRYHAQIYNEFDSCCFSGAKGKLAANSFRNTYDDQLNVEFIVVDGVSDHSIPHDLVIELLLRGSTVAAPPVTPASAERTAGSEGAGTYRIDYSRALGLANDGEEQPLSSIQQ